MLALPSPSDGVAIVSLVPCLLFFFSVTLHTVCAVLRNHFYHASDEEEEVGSKTERWGGGATEKERKHTQAMSTRVGFYSVGSSGFELVLPKADGGGGRGKKKKIICLRGERETGRGEAIRERGGCDEVAALHGTSPDGLTLSAEGKREKKQNLTRARFWWF